MPGRTPHEKAPEVLIYIPGFNASLLDGVTVGGQLLCLADFPPHLKAFMFSWPGGARAHLLHRDQRRRRRAQARPTSPAFVASIIDSGVREIHILAHSVGAHVLFSALHLILRWADAADRSSSSSSEQRQRRVAARGPQPQHWQPGRRRRRRRAERAARDVPDHVARLPACTGSSAPTTRLLRKLAATITLYCTAISDRALAYAEIFNKGHQGKALGKNLCNLVPPARGLRRAAAAAAAAGCRPRAAWAGRRRARRPAQVAARRGGAKPGSQLVAELLPRPRPERAARGWRHSASTWATRCRRCSGSRRPLETDLLTARQRIEGLPRSTWTSSTRVVDGPRTCRACATTTSTSTRYAVDDIRDAAS